MERMRAVLRSGAWLTRERVRLVALAVLIASTAGFLYVVVTADGLVDRQGRPLGTDFSNVYAAGTYVRDGTPDTPFDPALQHAREQKLFGPATPFYGWHYPPFFLFIAGALALLPYGLALVVWQGVTLILYLLMIGTIVFSPPPRLQREGKGGLQPPSTKEERDAKHRYGEGIQRRPLESDAPPPAGLPPAELCALERGEIIFDPLWLLLALAFPAVLINIGHGQNGFLTAALLGGALVTLQRQPLLAGVLFGLLAYKPQFGLMIPLALAAGGHWRAFAAAAATVALLALATTLSFGPHVWQAFLDSTRFTRTVALEQGNTGWYKIQSVFAWARMWGAPVAVAYALQATTTAALGAALIWLWRGGASYPLKAAALCLAGILATPYSFDYDMMVVAPAVAYLVVDGTARGFAPWERTALALLWIVPLIARSVAEVILIPLGVPVMIAAFALVLRMAGLPCASGRRRRGKADAAVRHQSRRRVRWPSGHDIAAFACYTTCIVLSVILPHG